MRPIVRSLAALLPALVALSTLASPGRALEVPARPEGRVSDYAGLLSPAARYVTGTTLRVSGGA